MFRASVRSLLARKLRLLLSTFAIVLGIAFVAGSLIFTDTLGKAFTSLMNGSVGDVVVQPKTSGEDSGRQQTDVVVPGSVLRDLRAVDGAARVDGNIVNPFTFVVGIDGKIVGGSGAPGIATNHTGAPAAGGAEGERLESGRWPAGPGEVVLDPNTASRGGYLLGSEVPFVSSGAHPQFTARLVGTATYGGGSLAGASLAIFETRTAQTLFMEGRDEYNSAWVTAAPGISQERLRAAVAPHLPADLAASTGDAEADKTATQLQEALGFVNTFLLVFAGISLFVGVFLIVNTFSILVAQRSRELALFRAIGASRRQVSRSVLVEALVVGLLGSALGLVVGAALAVTIKILFAELGLDLSGTDLVFRPRTVVVSVVLGVLVTMLAAWLPARRAGKVPPVAAMRDDVVLAETGMRTRVIIGVVLSVAGAAVLAVGLLADLDNAIAYVGGGIFGVVLGMAAMSPLVGKPVIATLGVLYRVAFGSIGRMAEQNAQRNPRRTAATASALMIGVTLVSMMAVVGASVKASVDEAIDKEFAADYVVSNPVGMPFSPTVIEGLKKVDGVDTVTRIRWAGLTVEGDDTFVSAIEPATIERVQPITMMQGSLADLGDDGIILTAEAMKERRVRVGDALKIASGTKSLDFRVVGVYEDSTMIPSRQVVTLGGLARLGLPATDAMGYVTRDPGADPDTVKRALMAHVKDMPLVAISDQQAYADEQRGQIDQFLYIIYALLGLAIVIAILGIVNTLSLSVIERTREVGLLRAVGLSRRQLRTMLRLESIAIALLGAALGIGLGVAFGVALQSALASDGIDVLAIPFGQLGLFVAAAAVVGVLAALWPGRRAARLDVLRAITAE